MDQEVDLLNFSDILLFHFKAEAVNFFILIFHLQLLFEDIRIWQEKEQGITFSDIVNFIKM